MRRSMRLRQVGNASRWARRVALLGIVLLSGFGTSRAQDNGTLAGRVVDASGAGVAGARVWAVREFLGETESAAEAETDAHGRFSIGPLATSAKPKKEAWFTNLRRGGFDLVARDQKGRFAWLGQHNIRGLDPQNVELRLVECTESRGRLVDQNGRPIKDARIVPIMFQSRPESANSLSHAYFPPWVSGQLTVPTLADGSFVLKGLPKDTRITATIHARGFGSPRILWTPGEPITFTLDGRLGRITGRLKPPGQELPVGPPVVDLFGAFEEKHWRQQKYSIGDSRIATAGADGRFHFEDLQPGLYRITPHLGSDSPLVFFRRNHVYRVQPGETINIPDIPLEPAATVTGRVIDAQTRQGIPNVRVSGYVFSALPGGFADTWPVRTDAAGRFRLKTAKGKLQISIDDDDVPTGYVDRSWPQPELEVNGDRTWPDIKLYRTTIFEGVVVDPAGKAVAGADVFCDISVELDTGAGSSSSPPEPTKTKPDGTFRVPKVDPYAVITIWARSGATGAVTKSAVFMDMRKQKGPLKITVDPRFAFRVHGTVTDRAGKPVAGAEVSLQWETGHGGGPLDTYTADHSGRFRTGALFPGCYYTVSVWANGYAPFSTEKVAGVPGVSKELGTIKLAGTKGLIAGKVVGSDGKPIAGVNVFNRGNGLAEVSTRTDAHGRFRLEGLFSGRKYAFASKEGYRFTGTLVDGDRSDLTIRLLRRDEPPPAWKPKQGTSRDEDRGLARRILTRLWTISSTQHGDQWSEFDVNHIVLAMARIDRALALDWSARQGGKLDDQIKLIGAEVVADHDARAAIDAIKKTNDHDKALEKLIELAAWYADTDLGKARLFAEEAAATIKTAAGPETWLAKAWLGGVLFDLGRKDEGKKLVEEAIAALAPPARQAKPDESLLGPFSLPIAARALARFDLKRAQELAESVLKLADSDFAAYEWDKVQTGLAQAVAGTDPGQALRLMRKVDKYSIRDALIPVVYRCGAEHPEEALKIIAEMKDQAKAERPVVAPHVVGEHERDLCSRSEALGWLAVAVAKRDPKRAAGLIDQALAPLIDAPATPCWLPAQGLEITAARVALLARKIDYPDMGSVIARVLATRPNPAGWRSPGSYSASLVSLLALIDPATAREVIVQAREGFGPLPASRVRRGSFELPDAIWGRPHEPDLIDWALAEGRKAAEEINAALAEVERSKGNSSSISTLIRLAEILASSPAHREEMLWNQTNDSWYPGRDRTGAFINPRPIE